MREINKFIHKDKNLTNKFDPKSELLLFFWHS